MTRLQKILGAVGLVACLAIGAGMALAQNAGQIMYTMQGSELVRLDVPNSAAIAYTSTSSLRDGRFYLYATPLTGSTISLTVDQSATSLNPAGTLAALTINLPATKVDGKYVSLWTSQTITSLTLATTNGATVTNPVTTLAAGASVSYVYSLSANAWRRIT